MGRKPAIEHANGNADADEGFDEAPEFEDEGDEDENDDSDFGC